MDDTPPLSTDRSARAFVVVDVPGVDGPSRFELRRDGDLIGWATYRRDDGVVAIPHVETLAEHRGQGCSDRLMAGIVAHVRSSGSTIAPLCYVAADYLRDRPEHADLVAGSGRP